MATPRECRDNVATLVATLFDVSCTVSAGCAGTGVSRHVFHIAPGPIAGESSSPGLARVGCCWHRCPGGLLPASKPPSAGGKASIACRAGQAASPTGKTSLASSLGTSHLPFRRLRGHGFRSDSGACRPQGPVPCPLPRRGVPRPRLARALPRCRGCRAGQLRQLVEGTAHVQHVHVCEEVHLCGGGDRGPAGGTACVGFIVVCRPFQS